jgi:thioredoxin 1
MVYVIAIADPGQERLTMVGVHIILDDLFKIRLLRKDHAIMAKGIMDIDDSNFDSEIIQSDKPAVVDFWAPWCGPCKAIGPVIEELSKTYGEQVKFTKCNVDDNPVTPGKFGIKAIPTLIFFKEGKVVDQITGMVAKSKLEDTIKSIV